MMSSVNSDAFPCGVCGQLVWAGTYHTCTGALPTWPSCFHCMCGKLPALTGQPEHITCCKCGDRRAVDVAYTP